MIFRLLLLLSLSLLPVLVQGHGAEFLQAKLAFAPDRSARLELTADYGDNPMLNGEAEARAALPELLLVEVAGRWQRLADLAPLQIEKRSQLDLSSPMDYTPDANKQPHQLLVATWSWQPPQPQTELRFQVPKGCPHDVLFWLAREPNSPEPPMWKLLIAEDTTPAISVPARASGKLRLALELIGLVIIALVIRSIWRMDWSAGEGDKG